MTRLIIHIGRHKTGTSSLQHWLRSNDSLLEKQGISYPQAGTYNGVAHHHLADELHPRKSTGAWEQIAEHLFTETAHAQTVLLSSEAFQNITNMTLMKEFLVKMNVSDVKIICYLREYLDYAMSAFRQMVQNQNRFETFQEFCNRSTSLDAFFRRWRDVGDLELTWYERDRLRDRDIISDFCHRVGINASDFSIADQNPSIGGTLLAFKLAANSLGISGGGYGQLRRLAQANPSFRKPFFVDPIAADRARTSNAYNESVSVELGPPTIKHWSEAPVIPNTETIEDDLAAISSSLNIKVSDQHRRLIHESASWFSLEYAPDANEDTVEAV